MIPAISTKCLGKDANQKHDVSYIIDKIIVHGTKIMVL